MTIELNIEAISKDKKLSGLLIKNIKMELDRIDVQTKFLGNNDSQDFGTILGVVLGSAAIVTFAKGVADRIRRDRSSSVKLQKRNGDILIVDGVSEDTAKTITEFLQENG